MTDKTLLHPHDPFPALTVDLPGGRTLRLPDDLAGQFGVVLFYRGSWCPYCNAQLSAFQRALDSLVEMDVTVVALSVDDESTTRELIAKHGLQFPVGYGADPSVVADATGAFVNDDPPFIQSTGFVLDPGGRVVVSVYSSGAIGRLIPQDVIGLIRYLLQQRLANLALPLAATDLPLLAGLVPRDAYDVCRRRSTPPPQHTAAAAHRRRRDRVHRQVHVLLCRRPRRMREPVITGNGPKYLTVQYSAVTVVTAGPRERARENAPVSPLASGLTAAAGEKRPVPVSSQPDRNSADERAS